MGKRYIMFVDERGFSSGGMNSNFSMIGVIFECDYCIDLKDKECELKKKLYRYREELFSQGKFNISLDDIAIRENFFQKIDESQRKEFIKELPLVIRNLKMTIILSQTKQDINDIKGSYSAATKNLLKGFHSFIMNKNGECGGIIMEARNCNSRCILQQDFFNEYNERSINLSMLEDIQNKINTFVICEKSNKTYGLGIEVSNVLNNMIFALSRGNEEADAKLMSHGDANKILNAINHKIYKDTLMGISNKNSQDISYSNMDKFEKELKRLKEQLKLKDISVDEKEAKINELNTEIQLLSKQLEEVLLSRKSDNVIFQILSDIDFKMKGFEKKSIFAEVR